jgi:hypothetical protein
VLGKVAPFSFTTDCDTKFEPLIENWKTPSGSVGGLTDVIAGGALGISVTLALPDPPGPVAVIVTALDGGITAGAV